MNIRSIASACAAAVLSTLILTGTATETFAEPITVTAERLPTRTVSYADLNLASASGKAALYRRVSGAVRELCGSEAMRPGEEMTEQRNCAAAARKSADPQIAAAVGGTSLASRSRNIVIASAR